jgi:hypothetical protein
MTSKLSFQYAAIALIIGALAHIGGHIMGPDTIGFMGAPPDVIQGARDGTLLYYAMMAGIIGLLSGLAYLAWSKKKGRVVRLVLWVFTIFFILRGMIFVFFIWPAITGFMGDDLAKFWFHFIASLFILTIGLALGLGLWKTRGNTT